MARLPLPETLRLDAARLYAAQSEFQRLTVAATCLLLVRQSVAAGGRPLAPPALAATKARLWALLGDPSVRLPDIAAECARMAGGEGGAAREAAMTASLQRMLSRSAGTLKVRGGRGQGDGLAVCGRAAAVGAGPALGLPPRLTRPSSLPISPNRRSPRA